MRQISLGAQGFEDIRNHHDFYVDKTSFIKEWWEGRDAVTLITRPRRFGKTLNLDMLNCFFSNQYAGRSDLFEGLDIWQEKQYKDLQGTYPVILLSFADIKEKNYTEARKSIIMALQSVSDQYSQLWKNDPDIDKNSTYAFTDLTLESSDAVVARSLQQLSAYLKKWYGKKVLIFLDEYDTPLQEAYVNRYWDKMSVFIRSLFNSTFKTNPSMERGLMTGITRVARESIFSDLNNLVVVTATSSMYETCFGFTEQEVSASLDEYGLADQIDNVRTWYDGFTFGSHADIYNPWSITNYLKYRQFDTYWANTSENSLVGKLIRNGSDHVKQVMLDLLNKKEYVTELDEQIVFNQLDQKEDAIWSLLLAGGYLRVSQMTMTPGYRKLYHLVLTDFEVKLMFEKMFAGWFTAGGTSYSSFIQALLAGNTEEMNLYMNHLLIEMISFFDGGKQPSEESQPEKFYHGFVLGLASSLTDHGYTVQSNRESGLGRYDIAIIPSQTNQDAMIIELKIKRTEEKNLEESVKEAKEQIVKKQYDADLLTRGFHQEQIRHYGFAFEGKKVLIG